MIVLLSLKIFIEAFVWCLYIWFVVGCGLIVVGLRLCWMLVVQDICLVSLLALFDYVLKLIVFVWVAVYLVYVVCFNWCVYDLLDCCFIALLTLVVWGLIVYLGDLRLIGAGYLVCNFGLDLRICFVAILLGC